LQIVQDEVPARPQSPTHVANDRQVICRILEVPEAREEAANAVEGLIPEGRAHVVTPEAQRPTLIAHRVANARRREIEPGDVHAVAGQLPRVPAGSASKIEKVDTGLQAEPHRQCVDECSGFGVIPVRVERVVVGRVNP